MGHQGHGGWPRIGDYSDADTNTFRYDNRIRGTICGPLAVAGTPVSISVKITATGDPHRVKCAIYGPTELDVDPSDKFIWPLVAVSEEILIPGIYGTPTWYTFDMVDQPLLEAGMHYWICAWSENDVLAGGIGGRLHYSGDEEHACCTFSNDYDGYPPQTWAVYFPGGSNPIATSQIYLTYEETAAPDCINPNGWQGDRICGQDYPQHGLIPRHEYECQCNASGCLWVDLGQTGNCDLQGCINPIGEHGQIDDCGTGPGTNQPDTTHSYHCNDGTWEDYGLNCPFCPDCVAPGEDCINPPGVDGQTHECGAGWGSQPFTTHKYLCSNGVWVDQGVNCPACPDCPADGEPIPWAIIAGAVSAVAIVGIIIYFKKK